MASISWTDGTGSATLSSNWPAPANRFRNWVPLALTRGEGAEALGDGKFYRFAFRTDYEASFELPGILNTDVDLALRLQEHLTAGGICTVTTGDASSREYTECCLTKDEVFELTLEDKQTLEYALRLHVRNIAASARAMLCEYP